MKTKSTTAYARYNWKENQLSNIRQTEPSDSELSPHELPVKISLTANVPEISLQEVSAELNVDEADIKEAIAEEVVDDPEVRLEEFPNPRRVIFRHIDEDGEYKEDFRELREEVEYEGVDQAIDWLRKIISEEHERLNRPDVLNFLEDELQELKKRKDNWEAERDLEG